MFRLLGGGLVALAFAAAALAAPSGAASSGQRYIVVLKEGGPSNSGVAAEHARRHGARVEAFFDHALRGYSARIPAHRVASLSADPQVAYIEPDLVITAAAQTIPWGIRKIGADGGRIWAANSGGAVPGLHAYIIDSGIDPSHRDLNVVEHVNFAGGPKRDCNGHGTHIAGIIGAEDNRRDVVGVVPGIQLHGVKVVGCGGSGSLSDVIQGIDWVTANARKPAVANISLVGGPSRSLDDAVRRSVASGIIYSVAAGNGGEEACASSPARAGAGTDGIVTVAVTDSEDREASWSNYGACVDLWAPGVRVRSTGMGGGTAILSGSSMAAPHVAGGAARYLSPRPGADPASVEAALKAAAQAPGTKSKDGRPVRRQYARF
ncbi:MAG: S8 family peptidase, partial [Acidimicrobiales bacterium]